MLILIIILIPLLTLFILSIIYRNPYQLFHLFGKKGSGKSTYMVKKMIRFIKRGWNVYTDMSDVKINGVRIINAHDLEKFTPTKNSALFLDEIGLTWDARKFKSFPDGVNEWFKFQRKYKVFVYMNSQSNDYDLKLRLLTDHYILMNSVGVISVARPINRTVTITEPSAEAESRIADRLTFASVFRWEFIFNPRYFKYFDSFSAPVRPEIPYNEVIGGIDIKPLFWKRPPRHLLSK